MKLPLKVSGMVLNLHQKLKNIEGSVSTDKGTQAPAPKR
jgi:hypothetical protein